MDGTYLWSLANHVFDHLPLAAVIDDVIFCVHGGIPRPISPAEPVMESIKHVPCPADFDPKATDTQSIQTNQLINDLLWSDLALREQENQLGPSGFGQGERGPGAICYGEKAILDFLNLNEMSYIVRAHEPTQAGVNISKGGRVITLFSTSQVGLKSGDYV